VEGAAGAGKPGAAGASWPRNPAGQQVAANRATLSRRQDFMQKTAKKMIEKGEWEQLKNDLAS
jgi:hypothetical protein